VGLSRPSFGVGHAALELRALALQESTQLVAQRSS
jgi:hypothetical protein